MIWGSWQRLEQRLLPLFHSDEGLDTIQRSLESGVILRCGTREDGRPHEIYAFEDCYMQSFEPIATLIWSILPSVGIYADDSEDLRPSQISGSQILKDLKEWAELTRTLFSALDTPLSTARASQRFSIPFWYVQEQWLTKWVSFQESFPGVEPLTATRHMLPLFQRSKIPEGRNVHEPLLSLVNAAYAKAQVKHLLWDWTVFKRDMVRWEIFWKTLNEDTWFRSWLFDEGSDEFGKNGQEQGPKEMLRRWSLRLGTLEEQMSLRLRLREFDFNIDSRVDVEIK
ncbi:hypothetical protein GCG54_00014382 [Colletotrichum gloeosporioides]|uniref:Uncharacterized protein n=1 Tax=Colletotrichum gloeosporioides TaxID=474922 RepID=A0A8H4FCA5_COLGL|nr:uncharacterized protein GCG54_00014382 [Colletotrichum gloeosporioides]KAF3797522.1 hypothetical protein GCG54_00014382 [Colletotrichum gloeosporioides]